MHGWLLALAGCTSFWTQRVPSATGPRDPTVECASVAWPIIDAAYVGAVIYADETCTDSARGSTECVTKLALPTIAAFASAYSVIYGGVQYAACRLAQRDQARARGE